MQVPNLKPPVVNAGPSQTITLPVDSVSVTGTVTDADSKVTAYLWSEVSGPNVPVIAEEGSISTKIKVLIPQTNVITTLDLVNMDVTHLVNTMAASGNYGFMIRLQNEVIYNCRIFCSSKYSDATKHPKLVLVY